MNRARGGASQRRTLEVLLNRLPIVASFLLAACGGGIGDSVTLGELDAEQWVTLCEEVSLENPEPVTCGDVTITPATADECSEDTSVYAGCTATVGDLRDCFDAINADPCVLMDETAPAGCEPVFACALEG